MTYFALANPFQQFQQYPIAYWIMNILLYSITLASAKLLLFQHVSKIRVPVFIYVIMSIMTMFIDSTAVINDIITCGIAIALIYLTTIVEYHYSLTKITAFYLYPYAIFTILTVLISNIIMHIIHHWDPSMHSWIANNFDFFEELLIFGISWWFINGCQKLTKRYFATVVPYHYIWTWGVALSIFIINFFDYSVVLYHQFILPSPVITGVFVSYIVLLLFTMWITGKYYSYQQDNQLLTSELTNLQTYTSYVETLYDDLRKFRHDYKNILYTLAESFKLNDLQYAQSLLDEMLNSSKLSITEKHSTISHLANVQDADIKSLLFSKYAEAQEDDVQMQIEVEKPFKFHSSINSLDLIRILSILLDNAIHAAAKSQAKRVNVSLFEKGDYQYLIIGNSTLPTTVNLASLESSTKLESQHGLSLKNLRMILSRYPEIQHYVSSKNHWFEQTLRFPK